MSIACAKILDALGTLFARCGPIDPQLVAGLFYLGAGIGLAGVHFGRAAIGIPSKEASLRRIDLPWLVAVVIAGGVAGPLLLMLGLARTSVSTSSLLLNLQGLATMCKAWLLFHENVDRRLLLGALAIVAGEEESAAIKIGNEPPNRVVGQ